MTKKLEETFNLPPMDEPIEADTANLIEPIADNIDELSAALAHVDKIDQALTPVKNLEALEYMLVNNIHCFWHEHDQRTLTSEGYIWTYPDQETNFKSIICMINPEDTAPEDCYGICTDWVNKHK